MAIKRVGVAGCGLMGGGIAQVCAMAGFEVVVLEMEQRFLDKGLSAIERNLSSAVGRGKLARDGMDAAMARLKGTTSVEELAGADLVIEAIIEKLEAKRELFTRLDGLCGAETIFASNTSSLPIIDIAACTRRADRFVGLHFFNPVPVMKLVEVIGTILTSAATTQAVRDFTAAIGKTSILARDRAGFVVNYLLVPYLYEAIRMLEQGIATREDLDTSMTLGCGYPMGPLTLADYVGLDTLCAIGDVFFEQFHEARFAAPTLLKQMVTAGLLGRKSGEGFYRYGG